jgi:DNA invertase Pin-like site-specific DNA recombinase
MIAYSYSRLSSTEQADGDGLRRQEDTVEKYCRKMKLVLQKKTIRDIGYSGYHAEHIKRGALGVFLVAVDKKTVSTPCALVIESLDRLSRQSPLDAMGLLIDIVRKGVEIHTTMDDAVYKEGMKMGEMMSGLLKLCTGHEESDKKSNRHKSMWDEKRANAKKQIITRACPSWMKPRQDKTGFTLIPARAAIIREIFKLTGAGIGRTKIADHLNAKKFATWNDGIRWHASFIQKLMNNPNVLGHLRTGSWVHGKYIPSDELIENYYPAVITQGEWDAAHASRAARTRQYNRYDEHTARDMISRLVRINGLKAFWRNKGRRNPNGIYQIYYKTFDPLTGKVVQSVRREVIESQLLVEVAELDPKKLVRTPVADPIRRRR